MSKKDRHTRFLLVIALASKQSLHFCCFRRQCSICGVIHAMSGRMASHFYRRGDEIERDGICWRRPTVSHICCPEFAAVRSSAYHSSGLTPSVWRKNSHTIAWTN